MGVFLIRRLLWLVVVLFLIAVITFVLMHSVPGGPWDGEKSLPPAVVENLNQRYGLDDPWWQQLGDYLWRLGQGDLGVSYISQDREVREIIGDGLASSFTLGLLAFGLAVTTGLMLGVLSAIRKNGLLDYAAVLFASVAASVPSFVLGIFLVVVFSVKLGWLPSGGWGSVKEAVLPTVTLAALPAAYLARITRASMLEALGQDYVRTARAKGLEQRAVVLRHVLRNALIPVLTLSGPIIAGLVTGSFIVETVFSVPGVGRLFVQGVFQRDYGLIMGAALFYAFVVVMANLIVDIMYAVVDPRIRYS